MVVVMKIWHFVPSKRDKQREQYRCRSQESVRENSDFVLFKFIHMSLPLRTTDGSDANGGVAQCATKKPSGKETGHQKCVVIETFSNRNEPRKQLTLHGGTSDRSRNLCRG